MLILLESKCLRQHLQTHNDQYNKKGSMMSKKRKSFRLQMRDADVQTLQNQRLEFERSDVMQLHEIGLSEADIATELGIHELRVSRILNELRESGAIQEMEVMA